MSTYRLKNLLAPRSVALVGASPRHGSVGRAILNNIRKAQFKGEFGLVNPRYPEIDGVATVGSLGNWLLRRNWSSSPRRRGRSPDSSMKQAVAVPRVRSSSAPGSATVRARWRKRRSGPRKNTACG